MRFCFFLLLLLVGAAAQAGAVDTCTARGGALVMPVVELYTSEGCSSCPPADRWLSRSFHRGEANFLAFHVDYWDYIGWPDRFAQAAFSRRQRERVGGAGGRTVYTPQVMVGENVNVDWDREAAWQRVLARARQPAGVALTLQLRPAARGWRLALGAATRSRPPEGAQVLVAEYVDGQVSTVQAGENRGRQLHHDRVVRRLWGPWPLATSPMSRQIELEEERSSWGLTAFVQDRSGAILQSVNLDGGACATRTSTR